MTTTEHLQLIKSECERLLAIAEKRTQGEWKVSNYRPYGIIARSEKESTYALGDNNFKHFIHPDSAENAAFIATCAGRAEAAWRSTIAAIDCLIDCEELHYCDNDGRECPRDRPLIRMQNSIITAWPIELLTSVKS
jgi:hypothetical protein